MIFLALAVAWAVYLIPKVLRQAEDSDNSRSVESFSKSLRVLARRDAVDANSARLVVTGEAPSLEPKARLEARRAASRRAAQRRMRVFRLLVALTVVVGAVAGFGYIPLPYVAIPVGLLAAWLVACRVMVKQEHVEVAQIRADRERAAKPGQPKPRVMLDPATEEIAVVEAGQPAPVVEVSAATEDAPAEAAQGWDPVPTTLPTYVGKEAAAKRTVRTIDLDSTGVWSSGRKESDSQLAREADESARAAKAAADAKEAKRATGS